LIDSTSQNGIFPSVVVASAGLVHVAWSGLFNGQYDVFYARNESAFGGGMWGKGTPVNSTKTQDDSTAVAVDAMGTIHVGWVSFEHDLFVSRSADGGKTWSMPVRVNDVAGKAYAGIGSFLVAAPDGRVHAIWGDRRTDPEGDIWTDSAAPGGAFGADVKVSDDPARWQEDPSLAVGTGAACKGLLYAVWQDLRSNKNYDIYASRSVDGGKSWEKNVAVPPKLDGDQMNPAIAVHSNCTVAVAWRDSAVNPKFDVKATTFRW
jgi:hypothetical protein